MKKRELVNLFVESEVYDLIYNIFDKRGYDTVDMNFRNSFNTDILLIHNYRFQDSYNSKAKIALKYIDNNTLSGNVYGHKFRLLFTFKAIMMPDDQYKLVISAHANTEQKKSFAKSMIDQNLIILSMINNGELAASDDLNRKDRRRIAKNNAKQPEYSIEGETYKIIDISKHRKYLERKRHDDSLIRQREHMRRGHYRHYKKTGKIVWIDAYKAGDSSLGVIVKDYKI